MPHLILQPLASTTCFFNHLLLQLLLQPTHIFNGCMQRCPRLAPLVPKAGTTWAEMDADNNEALNPPTPLGRQAEESGSVLPFCILAVLHPSVLSFFFRSCSLQPFSLQFSSIAALMFQVAVLFPPSVVCPHAPKRRCSRWCTKKT